MREKTEEIKGRVKEAAGVLAENKKLERSGQVDQHAAKVKQKVSSVADKAKKAVHRAVDKLKQKTVKR